MNLELTGDKEIDWNLVLDERRRGEDARYFRENYGILQEQFPDKYVAIFNQRVVGHSQNLRELLTKLGKQRATTGEYIERTYVKDKPPVLIFPAA